MGEVAIKIKNAVRMDVWTFVLDNVIEFNLKTSKVDRDDWVNKTCEKIVAIHHNVMVFNDFGNIKEFKKQLNTLLMFQGGILAADIFQSGGSVNQVKLNKLAENVNDLKYVIMNSYLELFKGKFVK